MASPQLSGYQCQFVDSVEDYECLLCLHVTREPFLTSCCGQHFCQVCINRILTDNKPCPFCKSTDFSTLLDKKQRRKILGLKVYCDKKAEGCQWVGGLGELEQHLSENCQFVTVSCPNNCRQTFQRRVAELHEIFECPKRPHTCQYCNARGTYQEIQDDHLPVCPKYPVPCPNECGVSPLERDQLEDHLRECPLQLVECELREMGCEEMVKRKDLARHMEEGAQKHLTVMASKYLKTQAEMYECFVMLETKLEQENEGLKKELKITTTQKDKEISDLKGQLELFRQHLRTSTLEIDVSFNLLKNPKSPSRWKSNYTFIFPSHCMMTINLYTRWKRIEIELTHVESAVDGNLQWPKKFTMTVRLLNQAGDHDHYQVTRDVEVRRGGYNDGICIPYATIENPPRGVQYIKNDHIRLEFLVTEN